MLISDRIGLSGCDPGDCNEPVLASTNDEVRQGFDFKFVAVFLDDPPGYRKWNQGSSLEPLRKRGR